MSSYIGRYAYRTTAKTLLEETSRGPWLEGMATQFRRICPFELTNGQIRAWGNLYDVLVSAIAALPEEYMKLRIVFEYVMPQHNPLTVSEKPDVGVRADVILLSADKLAVLEFKDLEGPFEKCEKQVLKYKNRLQKWHVESTGMSKKAIMVFTKADDMLERVPHATFCSPDRLAEAIREAMPTPVHKMSKTRIKEWLGSDWAVKAKYLKAKVVEKPTEST